MISMSKAWDKEKIWIPDRIQTDVDVTEMKDGKC